MNRTIVASSIAATMMFGASPVYADDLFTGDVRLACEAILCLSTGARPGECAPSISRYFGISHRKFTDTLKARKNFLNLCPSASVDTNMRELTDAITNGAGRCDAAALNASMRVRNPAYRPQYDDYGNSRYYGVPEYIIKSGLPAHCSTYSNHAYTDKTAPVTAVYVGEPGRGGYWTDQANYEAALAEYNNRLQLEDQRNRNPFGNYR